MLCIEDLFFDLFNVKNYPLLCKPSLTVIIIFIQRSLYQSFLSLGRNVGLSPRRTLLWDSHCLPRFNTNVPWYFSSSFIMLSSDPYMHMLEKLQGGKENTVFLETLPLVRNHIFSTLVME